MDGTPLNAFPQPFAERVRQRRENEFPGGIWEGRQTRSEARPSMDAATNFSMTSVK